MVGPIIENLAQEYSGRVKVGKLNVDDNQTTAITYRVMSIPTVILFKDGEPVETMVGAMPKAAYEQRLAKHLGAVAN
jgi:thioredoxin 1